MRQSILFIALMLVSIYGAAQVTTAGNSPTTAGVDYVGWQFGTGIPLDIKNEDFEPIRFWSNNGGMGGFNTLRMFIEAQGNVGIGNHSSANTLLHLHRSNDFGVDFQMTDNSSGQSTTDGFEMEYHTAGYFNMTQNEFVPFDIRSQGTDGNEYRRIRIWGADTVGRNWTTQHTRVGILTAPGTGWEASNTGSPVTPLSMLHIGDGGAYVNNQFGFRTWMNYGTLVVGGTDNVFFGLKSEETMAEPSELIMDISDAVVSWGDNAENNDNQNDFRFIYTASDLGSSNASARAREFDGEEMARISWNGNMGIGNFYNLLAPAGPIVRPARRLEVLDGGRDQPQFRLTFEQTGVVTGGSAQPRWTDFKATSFGDLLIQPTTNGNIGRVGINIGNRPLATLDIRGTAAGTLPQLRLTHAPVTGSNAGTWTDFQTTTIGDLFINPNTASGLTSVPGNVGIHTSTPGNTLEINSSATSTTPGNSGLRFTDLRPATSTPGTANGLVLTVDGNGDVILVNDGIGGGTSICSGGTPSNFLVKFTGSATACSSAVYEQPTTNYVGVGTVSPVARFHSVLSSTGNDLYSGKFEINNTQTTVCTTAAVDAIAQSSTTSTSSIICAVQGTAIGNDVCNTPYSLDQKVVLLS